MISGGFRKLSKDRIQSTNAKPSIPIFSLASRAYQNTIAILLLSEFFGNKILFFSHLQYNIAIYCNTSEKKNAKNNELETTIKNCFCQHILSRY